MLWKMASTGFKVHGTSRWNDSRNIFIAGLEFNWNWPDKNLNQPRHTSVAFNSL